MEKLTELQVENLIENIIQKKTNEKVENVKNLYLERWNNAKTKKEKFQFFNEYFSNRKQLIKEGYLTQSIDEGIFSSLFSKGGGGFMSSLKEWFASKLVGMLGITDPELKKALSISIANLNWTRDWTKLLSPLQNCDYFAGQILHDVMEYYIDKKATEWFGDGVFATSMRNAVVDSLNDEHHIKKLEESLGGVLCGAIRKVFSGGVGNTIKNAMGGGSKTSSPRPGQPMTSGI